MNKAPLKVLTYLGRAKNPTKETFFNLAIWFVVTIPSTNFLLMNHLPSFFNYYFLGYIYWSDKRQASCKDTLPCLFFIFISRCISRNIISINLLPLYHLIYKYEFHTDSLIYKNWHDLKIHINQDFEFLDKNRSWNKYFHN